MSVEDRLAAIETRNKYVEANKAWETSWTRRGGICLLTYIVATAWLYTIGGPTPYIHATVPTLGYLLSTLSLHWLRKRFEGRNG